MVKSFAELCLRTKHECRATVGAPLTVVKATTCARSCDRGVRRVEKRLCRRRCGSHKFDVLLFGLLEICLLPSHLLCLTATPVKPCHEIFFIFSEWRLSCLLTVADTLALDSLSHISQVICRKQPTQCHNIRPSDAHEQS